MDMFRRIGPWLHQVLSIKVPFWVRGFVQASLTGTSQRLLLGSKGSPLPPQKLGICTPPLEAISPEPFKSVKSLLGFSGSAAEHCSGGTLSLTLLHPHHPHGGTHGKDPQDPQRSSEGLILEGLPPERSHMNGTFICECVHLLEMRGIGR